MNPLEVTFHVEVTHFSEKRMSRGVAKKIISFVPHPGMVVGTREILSVERVHWTGYNNFAIHLQPLAQIPRADPAEVYFENLASLKLMVENQAHMLDWAWEDEAIG